MNPEQRQRLEALRDHLAAMPPDDPNFDMETWKCGTARCAIGEGIVAGLLPGLNLVPFQPLLYEFPNNCHPEYQGFDGFDAVAVYFGILEQEAEDLFGDHNPDATPADVANGITEFIEVWDRQAAYYGGGSPPDGR